MASNSTSADGQTKAGLRILLQKRSLQELNTDVHDHEPFFETREDEELAALLQSDTSKSLNSK